MIGVAFVFLPLLFSLLTLASYRRSEAFTAGPVIGFSVLGAVFFVFVVFARIFQLIPTVVDLGTLFSGKEHSFELIFLFDEKALCLLGLSSFLYWIIVKFSRVYLHREEGFNRFFRTLFLSHFGLNLIATAGNFDLFFIGWEVVGLTSFLLVSFYRDRANPIWNAFRIYIVYRICDIGILLGAFLVRHQYGHGHHFLNHDPKMVSEIITLHPYSSIFLGLAILLPALGKSAQFPFSFWLPRALEGPTPSTAVFYGALSIHAGIFLLLRTQALWLSVPIVRALVFLFGFLSLVVGTFAGRAQANIKGQIGYASIAQVGIMFMELAMGWDDLVLIHLCSHAILRAYQFLTSPSVVTHFIRHPVQEGESFSTGFSQRPWIRRLSVGEFFLEQFWADYLVRPLRIIGESWLILGLAGVVLIGVGLLFFSGSYSFLFISLSLILSLRALTERKRKSALVIVVSSLFLTVFSGSVYSHSSTVFIASMFGIVPGIFLWLTGAPPLMLLGWLCMAGFPVSPFFLGEDLLVHNLAKEGMLPLFLFFSVFTLNGIVLARSFIQATWLRTARPFD